MYSEYQLLFTDGTDTLIIVGPDEAPIEAIADLCDAEGWPITDVTNYRWTGRLFDADGAEEHDANA